MLGVIVTLALVLTPAIGNYLSDARTSRTRNDVKTIASALIQFNRDTGLYPMWAAAASGGAGTAANKVDLLISNGNIPSAPQSTLWTTGTSATLIGSLISNTPGYTARTASSNFGWNGPYLSSAIEGDPWNNRYAVNVGLIDSTSGGLTMAGTPKSAVWVLSAGQNGTLETGYGQPATTGALAGDDIGFRIQ